MIVEKNKIVSIFYNVTDVKEILIDSNMDYEPLHYLHGAGNILPALEKKLEGALEGEARQVLLMPQQAYGAYNEALVVSYNKDAFEETWDTLKTGMILEATDGSDQEIIEILPDKVIVNSNHPLAGKELCFNITIHSIREATGKELLSGRPIPEDETCGPGCCC